MDNFFKNKNSCIIDIFHGFQGDINKCNLCNYSKYKFQGFSVLNIPIIKANNIYINSLVECLNYYEHKQSHYTERGFSCPKFNGVNISIQTRITSLLKVLIINLKE
jgi:ubiquitin C-terminal hydrolase